MNVSMNPEFGNRVQLTATDEKARDCRRHEYYIDTKSPLRYVGVIVNLRDHGLLTIYYTSV
jgi:hypothetical protein